MTARRLDINPDDLAARLTLRDQLAELRRAAGMTQVECGHALNTRDTAIGRFENDPTANSTCATFAERARIHGHILRLQPIDVPCYADTNRDPEAAFFASFPGDAYAHAAVFTRLAVARRAAGISNATLARTLGVSAPAIPQMDNQERNDPWLSTWQRYARAAGGRLDLCLDPIGEAT